MKELEKLIDRKSFWRDRIDNARRILAGDMGSSEWQRRGVEWQLNMDMVYHNEITQEIIDLKKEIGLTDELYEDWYSR
jgi:hypothetical protein